MVSTPIEIVTEPAGDWFDSSCALDLELLRRERRGIHAAHSPELSVVPREPNYFGGFVTYTHSGPWGYTQEVPLLLYGPGFIKSQGDLTLDREPTLADMAPTVAELLGVPFPEDRPGVALSEALVPEDQRSRPPKVVLTIVWDGGGWNVLDAWPDAWPNLKRLMEEGTSVANTIAGSAPSVTPAIHANIGTGAFPKQHGIVDIPIRDDNGIGGAYQGRTPRYLEIPTLADLYDPMTGNAAKIGMFAYKSWHLGMIGHGAFIDEGDKDIAVIADQGSQLVTNPKWYSLPSYLSDTPGFDKYRQEVDINDGQADGKWLGHDLLDNPKDVRETPVWTLYQTKLLKTMLEREGFGQDPIGDLFYINYKQVDEVGHAHNMLEPEVRDIVEYADGELKAMVEWLDRHVGKRQWVVMLTADHGQGPDPLRSGAWPIRIQFLKEDIGDAFQVDPEELFDDHRPGSFWVNDEVMAREGITLEDLANFFIDYRLEENLPPGEEIPDVYADRRDELIFSAAFPSREMGRVWHCATKDER